MALVSRLQLCNEICKKIGLVRKDPNKEFLDKRELLHVNSALDLLPKTAKKRDTNNDQTQGK